MLTPRESTQTDTKQIRSVNFQEAFHWIRLLTWDEWWVRVNLNVGGPVLSDLNAVHADSESDDSA
jgi:hypothetical protein